nr:hypothetical protein CFP56_19292 [Quercus suber]
MACSSSRQCPRKTYGALSNSEGFRHGVTLLASRDCNGQLLVKCLQQSRNGQTQRRHNKAGSSGVKVSVDSDWPIHPSDKLHAMLWRYGGDDPPLVARSDPHRHISALCFDELKETSEPVDCGPSAADDIPTGVSYHPRNRITYPAQRSYYASISFHSAQFLKLSMRCQRILWQSLAHG